MAAESSEIRKKCNELKKLKEAYEDASKDLHSSVIKIICDEIKTLDIPEEIKERVVIMVHTTDDINVNKTHFHGEAIYEARSYGVSVDDISDKNTSKFVLLHPEHLGYSYNYLPNEGSWGECWNEDDYSVREEAFEKFTEIYKKLKSIKYLYAEFIAFNISGKGYSNFYSIGDSDEIEHWNHHDFVVFCAVNVE